jgi:hypothetical protein
MIALTVLAAVALAMAGTVAFEWHRRGCERDRLLQHHLRDRFIITLATGETFEGLLTDVDERTVWLVDAYALAANGDRAKADGELALPRAGVLYLQRP